MWKHKNLTIVSNYVNLFLVVISVVSANWVDIMVVKLEIAGAFLSELNLTW